MRVEEVDVDLIDQGVFIVIEVLSLEQVGYFHQGFAINDDRAQHSSFGLFGIGGELQHGGRVCRDSRVRRACRRGSYEPYKPTYATNPSSRTVILKNPDAFIKFSWFLCSFSIFQPLLRL